MIARAVGWYDERPATGDAWLALLLLVAFAVPSDLGESRDRALGLAFSAALLACVPPRRRWPVATFAAVAVLCLAQLAAMDRIVAGEIVALIATYTVVAYASDARLGAVATGCAVVGALIAAVRWDPATEGVGTGQLAATTAGAVLLAATLGAWRRSRRAELGALRERTRLLVGERDQLAALGAARERARIARELHDVVAHSLSVIVVQADGAAAGARERPDVAVGALETIGETGRSALGQMRRLLGVLREAETGETGPQPGVGGFEALVAQLRAAGLPVDLHVVGEARALEPATDLTVYRVAQEALTNALKHAEAVSRVDLELRFEPDAVAVRVHDDGRGIHGGDGAGHGLVGMRERVDLHAGTLRAGPVSGGGFEVHAVIPTTAVTA